MTTAAEFTATRDSLAAALVTQSRHAWTGLMRRNYDYTGDALADEISDTVAAYAPGTPGYRITIVMAERLKTFP